jgi:hypothetical protein
MTYIAKGTPDGYDVKTAVEYLNTFTSSAPLVKIHDSNTASSTVSHDLGYPPFFFITYPSTGFVPGAVNQFSADEWSVSSTQLVRSSGSGSVRYYIARLDLTDNFSSTYISGDEVLSPSTSDYVFKLSKPGFNTESSDMRDYSLHSNTKSPVVHKVDNGIMTLISGTYFRVVAHDLPYTPTVLVFMRPGTNSLGLSANNYGIVMPPIGISGRYFVVDYAVSGQGGVGYVTVLADSSYFSSAPTVSVVILKEPINRNLVPRTFP